jgi:uncharacterized membrane protein (DUF2068 family)
MEEGSSTVVALTIPSEPRQLKVTVLMEKDSTHAQMPVQTLSSKKEHHHSVHDRGLLTIGLFKLGKAILFFGIGVGVIHMLHKDFGDEVMQLATALKFDPESRFVTILLEKADLIDVHRLKQIGFATFAYSALALTEGVGLLMEKVWAEYLTLILTISFLPWELYELVSHPSWFRVGLLLINLIVLGYLMWLLRRKKNLKAMRA